MKLSEAEKVFKALACGQRLMLLRLLREWNGLEGCCDGVRKAFTRASKALKISRSTISHHFKELENAGIIVCRRDGQAMECRVNEAALAEAEAFLTGKDKGK